MNTLYVIHCSTNLPQVQNSQDEKVIVVNHESKNYFHTLLNNKLTGRRMVVLINLYTTYLNTDLFNTYLNMSKCISIDVTVIEV